MSTGPQETLERPGNLPQREDGHGGRPLEPGLLLIFSSQKAMQFSIPLDAVGMLLAGRGDVGGLPVNDGYMSRQHASVVFDGVRWTVRDLGSRNGTRVDGSACEPEHTAEEPRVLWLGESVFLFCRDLGPHRSHPMELAEGRVAGPSLQAALALVAQAARHGSTLHVTGESGSGKEHLARAYHRASGSANGPFVPVNCAAIPESLAERLLFGAKKGAFSGAEADAPGYVQAANGGTLFLDEVAELPLGVQAKLLRVLETGEVLRLGDSRPVVVDIRICSATHKQLRDQVAAGRFREDLYYRLGRPVVAVPPLRERPEEIPWLIEATLGDLHEKLRAESAFVEACLLRRWPGNVRELILEVRTAAQVAMAAGAWIVEARHLGEAAGATLTPMVELLPPRKGPAQLPDRETIEEALRRSGGKVATAARALGIHRTQLRRWLAAQQDGGE
jgi:transcriptional regulator of acetoin/glycerol metabolism